MSFSLAYVDDTTSTHASYTSQISSTIEAAGRIWQSYIAHDASIEVGVIIAKYTPAGSPGTAHALASPQEFVGTVNGLQLYRRSAVNEFQTGRDLNGSTADIIITIDPTFLENLWFDPTPATSNDIPAGRLDAITVFMHEIGHSLGFSGWRNWTTGELSSNAMLAYDQFVVRHDGYPWFNGPIARGVYGGDVPLTLGSPHHYGNPAGQPGAELAPNGLMNGITVRTGARTTISELDLAILQDMGLDTTWYYGGTVSNDRVFINLSGTVDLGPGLDSAIFYNPRSSYSITATGNEISVTNRGWQNDHLVNVERLQFSDGVVAFDIAGNAGNAYRLYQAAFDRTPDVGGLSFWVHALDRGADIQTVAQGFVNAAEFRTVYGTNPSNTHIVDLMYQNVLGRAGEPAGISFWVGQLNGGLSVGALLQGFAVSSENHGIVDPIIAQGIVLDQSAFLL